MVYYKQIFEMFAQFVDLDTQGCANISQVKGNCKWKRFRKPHCMIFKDLCVKVVCMSRSGHFPELQTHIVNLLLLPPFVYVTALSCKMPLTELHVTLADLSLL